MKSIFPKIIILGATGMLGRAIYKYLSKKYSNVYGTSRKPEPGFIYLNALSAIEKLKKIFVKIQPKFVINCIGILKGGNKKSLKRINSDFPKIISLISGDCNFKIINISTDAVFDNLQKEVDEDSAPASDDEYGESKLAGEQKNILNIRTSIIGFDPNEQKGILESLIKNRDNCPIGYTNQKWSGATTLQVAQFIEKLIYSKGFKNIFKKTNVIHFAPIRSNKYNLVKAFSNLLKLKKPIKKLGKEINRTLKSKYIDDEKLKHYGISLKKALRELLNFEQNYVKNYKKY